MCVFEGGGRSASEWLKVGQCVGRCFSLQQCWMKVVGLFPWPFIHVKCRVSTSSQIYLLPWWAKVKFSVMVFKWPVCSLSHSIGWKLGLCSPESWCAAVQSVGRCQCNVFAIRFLSCTVGDSFQNFPSSPFSPTLKTDNFLSKEPMKWIASQLLACLCVLTIIGLCPALVLVLTASMSLNIGNSYIHFFHPTLTRSKHCSFLSARFAQSLKVFKSLGKMG